MEFNGMHGMSKSRMGESQVYTSKSLHYHHSQSLTRSKFAPAPAERRLSCNRDPNVCARTKTPLAMLANYTANTCTQICPFPSQPTSSSPSALKLEPKLIQDRLRHILILPRPSVDLLKLYAMQTENRHFHQENLELQHHIAAHVALHVR